MVPSTPIRRRHLVDPDTPGSCERACLTNTRCEAYTFNSRNGSCFLKADPGEAASFAGAQSAWIVAGDAALIAAAPERRGELDFVPDWEISNARDMAASLGRTHATGPWSAEEHLRSAAENEASGNAATASPARR